MTMKTSRMLAIMSRMPVLPLSSSSNMSFLLQYAHIEPPQDPFQEVVAHAEPHGEHEPHEGGVEGNTRPFSQLPQKRGDCGHIGRALDGRAAQKNDDETEERADET